MRALVAILAVGLLCSVTEARFSWQWQSGVLRSLLQVTPTATAAQPGAAAAAAGPVAPAQTAQTAPQTGAVAAQPAAQPAEQPTQAAPADVTTAAATPEPKEYRKGVYVIEDTPPPPPKGALNATAAAANRTANATGPAAPQAGKNLMVVMTVMGQEAKDIYTNQQSLKQQVADAAGVKSSQVYFYNQTANMDPRTGVTAMSLIMNVDCTSTDQCAKAGMTLYNTSSQTRLTDSLARSGISLLPGTFQLYGVNSVGKYKGNDTLYENKALLAPKVATTTPDYNATMAMFNTPPTTGNTTKGKAAAGTPSMPLGNFSIPGFTLENLTVPTATMPAVNLSSNLSGFALPGQLPGAEQQAPPPPAEKTVKNAAGTCTAALAALPLLAAAAAVLLL